MTRKAAFFERWPWFKFNDLGLALGTNLEFYTSVAKGLKLKVRKFLRLISTFVEVTGEKLEGTEPHFRNWKKQINKRRVFKTKASYLNTSCLQTDCRYISYDHKIFNKILIFLKTSLVLNWCYENRVSILSHALSFRIWFILQNKQITIFSLLIDVIHKWS